MDGWNKMKPKVLLLVIAFLSVALGSACQHQPQSVVTGNLENGWYYIVDGTQDSIVPTPIVTVKEFGALRVDSDYYGVYSIVIGKRIGFVFNDSLITSPQVNMRIESGNFQISTPQGKGIRTLYRSLMKEKKDSIDALFKRNGWSIDSLQFHRLSPASQDSLVNTLDYGEAKAWVRGFEE